MANLLRIELWKWRRTWFRWVTVGAALSAPLLQLLIATRWESWEWSRFMGQILLFHTLMTGPLLTTLIGAHLVATEYQYDTWKLSFTAPVARWQVYLAKLLVALGWLLGLSLLTGAGGWAAGLSMGIREPLPIAHWTAAYFTAGVGLAAMLPLYLLITLLTRNFFVTSGVGIVATFVALLTINSEYAGLYPISGVMILSTRFLDYMSAHQLLGSEPLWIAIQAAIAATGIVGALLYLRLADFR